MARPFPTISLRGPPLARWTNPRCGRGRGQPPACEQRQASGCASARDPPLGADPDMGPRRTPERRHVELELADLMAARTYRSRHGDDQPAYPRPCTWMARRFGPGVPPRNSPELKLRPTPSTPNNSTPRHIGPTPPEQWMRALQKR